MRTKLGLWIAAIVAVLSFTLLTTTSWADEEGSADADHDGTPDGAKPAETDGDAPDKEPDAAGSAAKPGDADGDGTPDDKEAAGSAAADQAGSAAGAPGDADGSGTPDDKEAAGSAAAGGPKPGDADGDGTPDAQDTDDDNDGIPDAQDGGGAVADDPADEGTAADLDKDNDGTPDAQEEDYDPEDPPTDPWDEDGDGVVEEDERELRAESEAAFADIPDDVDDNALEAREAGDDGESETELVPSLDVETFRKLVRIAKRIVLAKMEHKIAHKTAKKMQTFSLVILAFSGLGIFLLLMPLGLKKKYPNQMGLLFKYSALAAFVFIVTVNMFGGVIYGFRFVQTAMSSYTNPATAIAGGTFDTLDENADDYIVMGKELFAPTLDQMKHHPDEQPAVLLLENGLKVVKDAKVFLSIAKLFKRLDFVFGILPIVLMAVTLLLFVLAIKPTLVEIVKLPAQAAAGAEAAGKDVMKKSMTRVIGELKATVCTIGILVVLTLLSGTILGFVVKPAIGALLEYFALAVSYLQFADGASSGLVFMALFGVILFLVLNLASLILSMAFFLGKSQKIFQAKFNHGVPLGTHVRFFKWGTPSVLLVQLFPLGFVIAAGAFLGWLNDSSREGVVDAEVVPWTKIMLSGPLSLVFGYLILFWAVRGVKAIKFLATYKIPKQK